MGVQVFEVGLFKPSATDDGQAVMIPRTWDIDTLTRSIPWLRLQNADGRNIYIRPKGEHDLSLVDDLTTASVQQMRATGFAPALVVETSPGNFQAWLKHPRPLSKELSTAAARALAGRFDGDPGAADWRHFGRLSGFTNRKPAHIQSDGMFPFVRLREASGVAYTEGHGFVSQIEARIEEDRRRRDQLRDAPHRDCSSASSRSIDSFRANPIYAGDGTRVDLAYSIYALSRGASDTEVETALRSRDLSHKGTEKRQAEYVTRTIRKAHSVLGRQVGSMHR